MPNEFQESEGVLRERGHATSPKSGLVEVPPVSGNKSLQGIPEKDV